MGHGGDSHEHFCAIEGIVYDHPTSTPTLSFSPTPLPSISSAPSVSPRPSHTATPVPTPDPTRTPTPGPSHTPTRVPTPDPTPRPTPLPTPAPSIHCDHASGLSVYRLFLFDEGGNGWEGGHYEVRNSTMQSTTFEGQIVARGTMHHGAVSFDWMCLSDGCYELYVGGGEAESEISFE